MFDQFKNKFHEKKSSASNVTAKTAQAVFLCLVHNLMVCYKATLAKAGIRNIAEEKRPKKILTVCIAKVEKTGRKQFLSSLVLSGAPPAPHLGRTSGYLEESIHTAKLASQCSPA